MIKFIALAAGWTLYYFIHSLLAADSPREYLKKLTGWSDQGYRLFYSIVSVIGLLVMIVFLAFVSSGSLFPVTSIVQYVSLSMTVIGVIVIRRAFQHYSLKEFLGLEADVGLKLQKAGILKHIRHPLYSGTILILIGMFMYSPTVATLITVLVTFAYLAVAIPLEERKLIKKFGNTYLQYRKKVPALIPRFW
jgi:protein-S-isoprenylcysteine O-methyltransferase Ste14